MAVEARSSVSVRVFLGFSTDADPFDRPPGLGRVCLNAEGHDPGILRSRKGYESYAAGAALGGGLAQSLTYYDRVAGPAIVVSPDRVWYAQSREGLLYESSGDGPVRRWDGVQADWEDAGVPAPEQAPSLGVDAVPPGFLSGSWTAYLRFVDRYGNVGNPSGASNTITIADVSGTILGLSATTPVRCYSPGHGLLPGGRLDVPGNAIGDQIALRWPEGLEETKHYVVIDDDNFDLYNSTGGVGAVAPDADRTAGGEWAQNITGFSYGVPAGAGGGAAVVSIQVLRTKSGSAAAAYVDVEEDYVGVAVYGSTTEDGALGEALILIDPFTGDASGAVRFGLPPEDKPYLAPVGGRLVGAGDGAPGGTPPDYKQRRLVQWSEAGYPEGWNPLASAFLPADSEGGRVTGQCAFDDAGYILCEHRAFRFGFTLDPAKDGNVLPAFDRGAVNNRCWVRTDQAIFALDRRGVYRYSGGHPEPLSDAIQNIFSGQDDTYNIDWDHADDFHLTFDAANDSILCFVSLDDGAPKHVLAYRLKTQAWELLEYPVRWLSSALALVDGQQRVVVGLEGGGLYVLDSGESDDGDPIAWRWRSGWYDWVAGDEQQPRAICVTWKPTAAALTFTLKIYRDQSDDPVVQGVTRTANGITTTKGSAVIAIDSTKANGYARIPLDWTRESRADGWRRVSVELSGESDTERIAISQIEIEGAQ